jgi:hypothetical protein
VKGVGKFVEVGAALGLFVGDPVAALGSLVGDSVAVGAALGSLVGDPVGM